MDDFISLLQARLESTERDLATAREKARLANEKVEELSRAADAYRQTLSVERKENVAASASASASPSPSPEIDDDAAADSNKSALVRKLASANLEQGITPKDVRGMFRAAGLNFHPNYPYAVLRRLVANKTMRKIRGKYYLAETKKIAMG